VLCRAGIKQPSVEVRYDKLNASVMAPAGSSDGLFTVGVDLQVKVLVGTLVAAGPRMLMQILVTFVPTEYHWYYQTGQSCSHNACNVKRSRVPC
jgi:hypothetical protein